MRNEAHNLNRITMGQDETGCCVVGIGCNVMGTERMERELEERVRGELLCEFIEKHQLFSVNSNFLNCEFDAKSD